MKKHAIVVLDETGSMGGQEERVISSMNEYAQGLPDGTRLAVFKFDSRHFTKWFAGKVKKWQGMKRGDYLPGAMTPLYDAVGKAIAYAKRKTAKGDRVMFMIDTDGMENASTEYSQEQVADLIKRAKKRRGWEFLFMSAGLTVEAAKKVAVAGGQSLGGSTMAASYGNRSAAFTKGLSASVNYLNTGEQANVSHTVVDDTE